MNNITKTAAVIGHPIAHSKSPIIHNYWIKLANLNANYVALDVGDNEITDFLAQLRAKKYIGANVTLPHKQHLYTHCDQITPTAKTIGAVNTLYFQGNLLIGDNTDAYGFLANLDQISPRWDRSLKRVIILGAGGAARAVLHALLARKAQEIIVLNRTPSNAQTLVNWFSEKTAQTNLIADNISQFAHYAPQTDFLVNTSSVGLNNTKFDNLKLAALPAHALVHDIVYTPLITPLLADAKTMGLQVADGLGMLLHQAAPGFEKWFANKPVVDSTLRQLVLKSL